MTEYLTCLFDDFGTNLFPEVEKAHPGFLERVKLHQAQLDFYTEHEVDEMLPSLLREDFILSGMVEEASLERTRKTFERAKEKAFKWQDEDLKNKP
jgi:hypothetical protein